MKYRVKEFSKHGRVWFVPQYRYKYWPFWFSWTTSHTGHDISLLCFGSLDEAKKSIENQQARKKLESDNPLKVTIHK